MGSLLLVGHAQAEEIDYEHGYAFLNETKYPADFEHFDYVNPDAPKGGYMRIPEIGTWDTFTEFAVRGRFIRGVSFWDPQRNHLYDSLLKMSLDEPAARYGWLAEGVAFPEHGRWVAFKLRKEARWHDGKPVTAEDVAFSFNFYKTNARPTIKGPMQILDRVEILNAREVKLHLAESAIGNAIAPLRFGLASILPKHYWATRDLTKTTIEPPLGSGPYRVGKFRLGRWVEWKRVDDYWARDLPVNKGMNNFDIIKYDYFRDDQVKTEAVKANLVDVMAENVPRTWYTQYDTPAFRAGHLKKDIIRFSAPKGQWFPMFWNMEQPRFRDIRVREALWLINDPEFGNKRSYGFWGISTSFWHDSELAQRGLPSELELKLLEPLRDEIPAKVFTHEFTARPNQGEGWSRENLLRARQLLAEAGWIIKDGKLVHSQTGEPFHLRMVAISPALGRSWIAYTQQLKRLGITATIRAPETSNWLYRMRSGDFDVGAWVFISGTTPTMLTTNVFSSAAADQAYSLNWSNLRDPAVDELIGHLYTAKTWEEFVAAVRALDRVLLWNFYWATAASRVNYALASWNQYGKQKTEPLLTESHWTLWWWDEEKAKRVAEFLGDR